MKDYQSDLFPYAYNILGSVHDAEDAIQDVLLKYSDKKVKPDHERNYLIKSVINQSINLKKKQQNADKRNEWLPSPITTDSTNLTAELKDMVSYSLLFLLERLNPKERAVFILKEAFSYRHDEIADVLSITEESSRKLLSRAKKNVSTQQTIKYTKEESQTLFRQLDHFTNAIHNKDLETLQHLLTKDIVLRADGGGKVKVVTDFCKGANEVAKLLFYVHDRFQSKMHVKHAIVNHQPALLYSVKSRLHVCQVFEFDINNSIKSVHVILDPIKLRHLQ